MLCYVFYHCKCRDRGGIPERTVLYDPMWAERCLSPEAPDMRSGPNLKRGALKGQFLTGVPDYGVHFDWSLLIAIF